MQTTKISTRLFLATVLCTMKNVVKKVDSMNNGYWLSRPFYDAEAKTVVATDGRRLLAYATDELNELTESGYLTYDKATGIVVSDNEKTDEFPAWRRVVPVVGQGNYCHGIQVSYNGRYEKDMPHAYKLVGILAENNIRINGKYFQDVKDLYCVMDTIVYDKEKPSARPVVMVDENRNYTYVIMPISEYSYERVDLLTAKTETAA